MTQPTLFRLHTEDVSGFATLLARRGFDAATIIPATGIWKGNIEGAVIIELVQPASARENVLQLAEDIRAAHKQEAVLVTILNTQGFDAVMVTADALVTA